MNGRLLLALYAAAALTVASCHRGGAQNAQPGGRPATTGRSPQDLRNAKVNTMIELNRLQASTRSLLGSQRASDGLVTLAKKTFAPGDPIFLSIWFHDSPAGLQTSVVWSEAGGKKLGEERRAMHGEKTVTFQWSGKRLAPGKYHVTGYWGGNVAAEHAFEVK